MAGSCDTEVKWIHTHYISLYHSTDTTCVVIGSGLDYLINTHRSHSLKYALFTIQRLPSIQNILYNHGLFVYLALIRLLWKRELI